MKILKIVGIVLLALVVVIGILGFVAPKEYTVERSAVVNSPKELVYSHIKYWRNWQAWSPWAQMDSTIQVSIVGVDGEKGSMYKWVGKPDLTGVGEMINTGIKEYEEVAYHLRFIEPWESESEGYVRVANTEGGTKISWGMYGVSPFPWNIMMLFMSMDKMVGKDFERGLELLKTLAEKEAADVLRYKVQTTSFAARDYAIVRQEVKFEAIKDFYSQSFEKIAKTLAEKKVRMAGAPAGLYFAYDEQKMVTDMAAAMPVKGKGETEEVKMYHVPEGTAYLIDYYGPYDQSASAYRAMDLYLVKNGLKQRVPVIEEYITDPSREPDPAKWLTKIYFFAEN